MRGTRGRLAQVARDPVARGAAALLHAALVVASLLAPRVLAAQDVPLVAVEEPAPGVPLVSATPRFVAVARGLGVPSASVSLELQVATAPTFAPTAIVYDDTLPGDSVEFVPERPLPSGTQLWWRAIARNDGLVTATSAVTGPSRAAVWLALVSPDAPNGVVLDDRRPRFTWTSAPLVSPPGPWRYDIEIINTATGRVETTVGLTDTTWLPPQSLEVNASYRWAVTAYLPSTGDRIRVASQGSFVITTPDRPLASALYQNFPNPFPTPTVRTTCIWFDLARAAPVRLEVLTLRGERVRTLYPLSGDPPLMRPGRYGRADIGSNTGCDPRFSWDGRSDDGREVSPGVYLLRLRVSDRWETRKIVYRGG